MSKEKNIIELVRLKYSQFGFRLFRNSVGAAWSGNIAESYNVKGVSVIELYNARRVIYGLQKGSADLIGWKPLVITADMVGQTVAQFASIECKTLNYKKMTDDQKNWLEQIRLAGGYAMIARETENGLELSGE